MSDFPISEFSIDHDYSSIETCLNNIIPCDYFIIVIDKRYGPKLGKYGYENISATHLEYRKAVELKKPVLMFVRDITYSEYNISKHNKGDIKRVYISPENIDVFELIKEHTSLSEKNKNNWFFSFKDSLELKSILLKQLKIPIIKESLSEYIACGKIPILSIDVDAEPAGQQYPSSFFIKCIINNPSKSVTFLDQVSWDKATTDDKYPTIFSPQEKLVVSLIVTYTNKSAVLDKPLFINYKTYDGIIINEEYNIHFEVIFSTLTNTLLKSATLIKREFKLGKPVELKIS